MEGKKRVRRGESFGRLGVDRTISDSLKSPNRQKQRRDGRQTNSSSNSSSDESDDTSNPVVPTVHFAETSPMIRICSHYDMGMTNAEVEQRKRELWYSRDELESFLKERIATIRLLHAVQGDALALRTHCPDLCLRGLEPFSCYTLNKEMQCQRRLHQRAVLTEQLLQKSSKPDPERIRRLAREQSEWARVRAQQLASLDEMEVSGNSKNMVRRGSLANAQLGLERLALHQSRRSTLSHTTNANTTTINPMGLTSRRLPVDLAILKEWNAKFLAEIRAKSQLPSLLNNATSTDAWVSGMTSLSDKTAESRRALQCGSLFFPTSCLPNPAQTAHQYMNTAPFTSAVLGYGEQLIHGNASCDSKYAPDSTDIPSFRFDVRRDSLSLVGLQREAFFASRPAAATAASIEPTKIVPSACSSEQPQTDAKSFAEPSSNSGLSILSEACLQSPVHCDSRSNR